MVRRIRGRSRAGIDCDPALPIVLVKLSLIVSRREDFEAASRVRECVLMQQLDREAREIMLGCLQLAGQDVREEHNNCCAHAGDVAANSLY